ncbi:MAG: hypothetical protein ACRDN9_06405 [Streptosporangiaceae bacterium]
MEVVAPRSARSLIRRARAGIVTGTVALLVLVVVALAAASVVLALQARADEQEDARRQAVLQAARQEALNLTTLSYKTFDHDVGRVLDLGTGSFKSQYAKKTKKLEKALTDAKVRSRGKVLEAGLVSADEDSAQSLVVVDQTVQSPNVSKPALRHYRMRMTLVRKDGRWLVSKFGFAGVS